ncbi:MAG: IS5 family transposase [Flavobacteriales bacterium]|nr:IS5 family transposase [Flavobacteriales bacterium]
MKKRPTSSLFDEHFRDQALEKINDVLPRLSRLVNWEAFRPEVEAHFPVRDPKKGGQPPYDRLMLFKAVVLMELYGLSAEALEYQVNDRRSFQRFLGLEPQHQVPDSTTVRLFVEHLTKAKAMEGLFASYHARLSKAELVVNQGKIVDASMVHAPIQHNKREDRELLENGEVPANWSARKKAQKDLDATWAKKNSKSYHGYKNHVKVDAQSKLIDHYVVTTASVPDGEMAWELLDERDEGQDLYADKGYDWEDVKEGIALAKMEDRTHKKARRNKPLTEQEEARNKELGLTRARVEHVFGSIHKQLHGLSVRCIGLRRATFRVGLTNLCYNLLRTLTLLSKRPAMGSV